MKSNKLTMRVPAMVIAGLLTVGWAGSSRAQLVEGFENGFGTGESIIGDAGIQSSYFGIPSTQGTHQLLLTTINSTPGSADANGGYTNQSGNNSVTAAALGTFFGVSSASIKDGTTTGKQGSGFTIGLGALSAGQTIAFDYNFLTQEPTNGGTGGNKDFAFYTLTNQAGVTVVTDTLTPTVGTPGSTDPFGSQTQYSTFSINITAPGTYTLGLGVADAGNPATDDAPSALLVDNISVNTAVPEPSTALFCLAGLGLLGALRRFGQRS